MSELEFFFGVLHHKHKLKRDPHSYDDPDWDTYVRDAIEPTQSYYQIYRCVLDGCIFHELHYMGHPK